jgi:hypothetical protein
MKTEKDLLEKMKEKLDVGDEELLRDLFDKLAGLTIMTNVLIEEFKMSKEEVRDAVGFKETSWADKLKLMTKVKLMQKKRGGSI